MNIAIASDHGGFELKEEILKNFLKSKEFVFSDLGSFSLVSDDYPDFAKLVCEAVLSKKADYGILICTTGVGMSIAANRFRGIRAALCHSVELAKQSREHLDANVLVLGRKQTTPKTAVEIVHVFLTTPFSKAERHLRRLNKIDCFC